MKRSARPQTPGRPGLNARVVAFCMRAQAWLRGLKGWRRALAAVVLGVAATAALPPVYALPFVFIAFTGLLWLLDGAASVRQAAWCGWWFGLGHFTTGIYWVGLALLTDPERYGLLAPFAPTSLAAYLAVYPAMAAALTRSAARMPGFRSGAPRIIVFAIAWTVTEWLRGHLLTGFPWNPIGSVWGVSSAMMQFVSVFGTYGLALLTVIAAGMPALLGEEHESRNRVSVPLALTFAVVAVAWIGGAFRLAGPLAVSQATVPHVLLRLVQPNVAQGNKWREELRLAHLKTDLDLTDAAAKPDKGDSVFVIWPETAVPFLVDQDASVRAAIASVVPKGTDATAGGSHGGGLVITGAPRATPPDVVPFQVWNGIVALDAAGEVVGTYDKFHLVPFGEYLPLRSIIPPNLGLTKLTPGTIDFSAGPGPATLHLPGLPPVSPLICYEIIFPHAVVQESDRPGLMVNVTNDAWFGVSSGPYQHFESARFRAIEEGMPVARAANTGISGVIDSFGRVVARLGLGNQGSVDSALPQALPDPPLYARFGDAMLMLLIVACCGLGVAARRIP